MDEQYKKKRRNRNQLISARKKRQEVITKKPRPAALVTVLHSTVCGARATTTSQDCSPRTNTSLPFWHRSGTLAALGILQGMVAASAFRNLSWSVLYVDEARRDSLISFSAGRHLFAVLRGTRCIITPCDKRGSRPPRPLLRLVLYECLYESVRSSPTNERGLVCLLFFSFLALPLLLSCSSLVSPLGRQSRQTSGNDLW
jgi:hypothetical protein